MTNKAYLGCCLGVFLVIVGFGAFEAYSVPYDLHSIEQLKANGDINGLELYANNSNPDIADPAAKAIIALMVQNGNATGLEYIINNTNTGGITYDNSTQNEAATALANLFEKNNDTTGLTELLNNTNTVTPAASALVTLLGQKETINIAYSVLIDEQNPTLAEFYNDSNNSALNAAALQWYSPSKSKTSGSDYTSSSTDNTHYTHKTGYTYYYYWVYV